MTQQPWMPGSDDFIVIDSNVIITAAENRDYKNQCQDLIQSFEALARENKNIIIPQFVEYELLKRAKDMLEYKETADMFEKKYLRFLTNSAITTTASKIHSLYGWNDSTRDLAMNNKTLFMDLNVAATAIHWQKYMGKNTYILSSDMDFSPPYFSIKEKYKLVHKNGFQCLYIFLYEADKERILQDWLTYKQEMENRLKRRVS